MERRRHRRYAVDWRASLVPAAGESGEILREQLQDISLGGAGLWCATDVFTGTELVLLVEMPVTLRQDYKTILSVGCRMLPARYDEPSGKFHIGLRFTAFHGIGKHLLADELIRREQAIVPGKKQAVCSLIRL